MNGYTGGLLEADTFPVVGFPARAPRYVEHAQAMKAWQLIRENQPWDPTDPPGWAGDLYEEICLAIQGVVGPIDWQGVGLFTAVGSAVDWHGTDAWVEWQGSRVTLDVTANPGKLDGYKADVIIPPLAIEDPAERGELAAIIAAELLAKARQRAAAQQRRPRRLARHRRIGA